MDRFAGVEDFDAFVCGDDSVRTDHGHGFGLPVRFGGDAGEGLRQGGGGAQGVVPADAVDGSRGRGRGNGGDVVRVRGAVGGGGGTGGGVPNADAAFGATGPEGLGVGGDVDGGDIFLVALDDSLPVGGSFV